MSTTKKPATSPVVKLALMGIAAIGLYYASTGLAVIDAKIAELPVQGQVSTDPAQAPAVPDAAAMDATKSLHPLLVESKTKAATLAAPAASSLTASAPVAAPSTARLDSLFGRDVAQKEIDDNLRKEEEARKAAEAAKARPQASLAPELPAIDHFRLQANRIRVQGVLDSAAIINGELVELGAPVRSLGYTGPKGQTVYPTLDSVNGEVVHILEAGGKRKISAKLYR